MLMSQIAEVNANEFWDNQSHVNYRYCAEKCRMKNEEGTQFLMDGLSHGDEEYMLGAAKEYGCTEEFLAAWKRGIEAGGEFVMFYVG